MCGGGWSVHTSRINSVEKPLHTTSPMVYGSSVKPEVSDEYSTTSPCTVTASSTRSPEQRLRVTPSVACASSTAPTRNRHVRAAAEVFAVHTMGGGGGCHQEGSMVAAEAHTTTIVSVRQSHRMQRASAMSSGGGAHWCGTVERLVRPPKYAAPSSLHATQARLAEACRPLAPAPGRLHRQP